MNGPGEVGPRLGLDWGGSLCSQRMPAGPTHTVPTESVPAPVKYQKGMAKQPSRERSP